MDNQETQLILTTQNNIRISLLDKNQEKINDNSDIRNKILEDVITAYNKTIDTKEKNLEKLCDIFSQELKKEGETDINITKGFLALYRCYGNNHINDNLQRIDSEINKNDKFFHYMKSMFCCCIRNYTTNLQRKENFNHFVNDCKEAVKRKNMRSQIGNSMQAYINNKTELANNNFQESGAI